MAKYRIIERWHKHKQKGAIFFGYIPQKRFLFFFWKNMLEYGYEACSHFDDAMLYITQDKVGKKHPKNVICYEESF